MNKYSIGQQPCDNFIPQQEGNGYGQWDNVHECIFGDGECTVSFCLTCHRDHHSNGYETCSRERAYDVNGKELK